MVPGIAVQLLNGAVLQFHTGVTLFSGESSHVFSNSVQPLQWYPSLIFMAAILSAEAIAIDEISPIEYVHRELAHKMAAVSEDG